MLVMINKPLAETNMLGTTELNTIRIDRIKTVLLDASNEL
jgi:hypothetical protein